jgi:hypothetical protein
MDHGSRDQSHTVTYAFGLLSFPEATPEENLSVDKTLCNLWELPGLCAQTASLTRRRERHPQSLRMMDENVCILQCDSS